MMRFIPLLLLSSSVYAAGINGVPSAITGVASENGQPVQDMRGNSSVLSRYIVEQAEQKEFVKPYEIKQAKEAQRQGVTTPTNSDVVVKDQGIEQAEQVQQQQFQPRRSITRIEFEMPKGLKPVTKDRNGAAKVNADKPGTYVIRVPALIFSRFSLPFSPEITTPFPDQVVIKKKGGLISVAPKSSIPVNLIFAHPQRPELSVAFVLVPDGQEIPAMVDVDFDPSRIPQQAKDIDSKEVGNKVTTLGISSTIEAGDSELAARFERSTDHISVLEEIHRSVSKGLVPKGYSLDVITEGATGALCGDRRLIGVFSQRMRGAQFTVDVFSVTNPSEQIIKFNERDCYRAGVASVQFNPSRALAPGQKAELIIVHAAPKGERLTQQRRPTLINE